MNDSTKADIVKTSVGLIVILGVAAILGFLTLRGCSQLHAENLEAIRSGSIKLGPGQYLKVSPVQVTP